MKVEFDVKISAKDLFLFLFNNSYRKFTGVLMALFSLGCIGVVIYTWGDIPVPNTILLIALAAFYLVFNPLILFSKAKRQIKNNDYFNNVLTYEADEKGITVRQGEEKVSVKWEEMWKAVRYGSIVVVYISTVRAFTLPVRCMGDKYNDFVEVAKIGLANRCYLRKKK